MAEWKHCRVAGRVVDVANALISISTAEGGPVLILEDVPQLSSANYNEAKRFVLLIDTLYDARVRFAATSAQGNHPSQVVAIYPPTHRETLSTPS